jgi:hypothetical protein
MYHLHTIITTPLGYGLNYRGTRVRFPAGLGIFLFTMSKTALVPTQPPIQLVPGALSLGVKRPGREADHSPPSSAEVKECMELYLHSPYVFMAWCLVKHTDNFTFTLPTNVHVEVLWVVASCIVMAGYQCFGGPCCLHLQGEVKM